MCLYKLVAWWDAPLMKYLLLGLLQVRAGRGAGMGPTAALYSALLIFEILEQNIDSWLLTDTLYVLSLSFVPTTASRLFMFSSSLYLAQSMCLYGPYPEPRNI